MEPVIRLCGLLGAAAAILVGGRQPATTPSFAEMATTAVQDLQATVSVVKADQNELLKINKDFGFAYRLRDVTMWYKRPDKLRMDGRIGETPAQYIVNGATRFYTIPRLRFRKTDRLGDAPGKRYTLFDVGLVARCDVQRSRGRYVRDEVVDGISARVFEVTFPGDDTAKYLLWIDPRTHVVLRKEWHDGAGKLRATFRYFDVQEIKPGIWFPLQMEVLNGDGTLAGITRYADVKVNQGLADSEFEIS